MLTYRGGGGSRRPSSSASSLDTKSWLSSLVVRWSPIHRSVSLRCVFALLAVPIGVIGLLVVRLMHGIAVRICIALLSILPKGCPGLTYSSDHVSCSPASRLFVFQVDRGKDVSDVLESLIAQDGRFRMKLVYSHLGSNVWKECDDSWNFRDHVRQAPSPDVLLVEHSIRDILSAPLSPDLPPWRAVRCCEGHILVICVHRSLADAMKKCDDLEPCLYTPKKEIDPLVLLSRKLEGWIHAWFSNPTLVLHRVRSQFGRDTTLKEFNVASTRIIPTSFIEALSVRSERSRDDVLLSCVAGALRRSFQHLRGSLPQDAIAGTFTNKLVDKALLFPLWNADPVTRLRRMTAASKDPLQLECHISVTCTLGAGWRLPGCEILKSLHDWTLDPSGVHVHINETKEGLHVDVACLKDFLERPDLLAVAFEREVQDMAMAVGLHRRQVAGTSLTTSALNSQLIEHDFWSTKIQHVCEIQRKLASLVFPLQ
ncbi:uncharacterized protein LOC135391722 [Ornithodoros turicata]|uniref:uncharacterized protein LOC135391722 n=1 Tax=Ornithodoros turicata TaxID=34597 RepID=UPI0031396D0E